MSLPVTFSADDTARMARALQLAERGLYSTDPNPRAGCVIVKEGQIVGEGWHRLAGGPHAEIEALKAAGDHARGSTAYISLEPCCHHGKTPPCTSALIEAGIARVVAAMEDPNPRVAGAGLRQLQEAGIMAECGLLERAAMALNPGFCHRMHSGRPLVRSKLAMSLDGRTAMASGESQWITGPDARRDVHRLRARSSAIVTGVNTILSDNPALTARISDTGHDLVQPVRIVLDSRLRTPANARIFDGEAPSVLLTTAPNQPPAPVHVERLPATHDGRLQLPKVIDWLGAQGFNEVLIEAGPTLNGALLNAGLVDEWIIYMAPVILGDGGRGLFHLPELTTMAERFELKLTDVRQVGKDLRLTFRRN
jgi:diaminohydroxyphosphoribosylaminopyrimidine deaminase/5-amino-6-(5-phosphoribosylamino)uracil reductase